MQSLTIIEEKITHLLKLYAHECDKNTQLEQENVRLKNELEALEERMLESTMRDKELSHDLPLTKEVVDDLIKSIDVLIENN